MKLDKNTTVTDTLVQEIKIPDEYKKIDDFVPKIDGGKIFRKDKDTGVVTQVNLTHAPNYVLGGVNNGRLELQPRSWYIESVNMKNAIRKFNGGRFDFETK